MLEKGLPAIVDRAVWEKIKNNKMAYWGIRRDNVIDQIGKDLGGDQLEVLSIELREVWRVQGISKRDNRIKGKKG